MERTKGSDGKVDLISIGEQEFRVRMLVPSEDMETLGGSLSSYHPLQQNHNIYRSRNRQQSSVYEAKPQVLTYQDGGQMAGGDQRRQCRQEEKTGDRVQNDTL